MSHFFDIQIHGSIFLTLMENNNCERKQLDLPLTLFEKMEKSKVLYEDGYKRKNPYMCNIYNELKEF